MLWEGPGTAAPMDPDAICPLPAAQCPEGPSTGPAFGQSQNHHAHPPPPPTRVVGRVPGARAGTGTLYALQRAPDTAPGPAPPGPPAMTAAPAPAPAQHSRWGRRGSLECQHTPETHSGEVPGLSLPGDHGWGQRPRLAGVLRKKQREKFMPETPRGQ